MCCPIVNNINMRAFTKACVTVPGRQGRVPVSQGLLEMRYANATGEPFVSSKNMLMKDGTNIKLTPRN